MSENNSKVRRSPLRWALGIAFDHPEALGERSDLTAHERLVLMAVAFLADVELLSGVPITPAPIYKLRPATGLKDRELRDAINTLEDSGVLIKVDSGRTLPDEAYGIGESNG